MSAVNIININKEYKRGINRIHAVKSANLTIEKGSFIAIIGPSGAGKSTLLQMMGGLDTPTSGTVEFNGTDLYKLSDAKRSILRNRSIGFVFQFYNLLPEFSVMENVCMPAMISGMPGLNKQALEAKAGTLLDKLGIGGRRNHRPNELSGGEAQRASIARALINDPDLILCDEPTGNLDSGMGQQIYDIIYSINRERLMTVVVVTHHDVSKQKFDKVYYMKDGFISEHSAA